MIIGIDAANIRSGGGLTHLVEILRNVDPSNYGFTKVIVWAGSQTLNQIDDRPWLVKSFQPLLSKTLPFRFYWQIFKLPHLIRSARCNLLFIPGGICFIDFCPIVAMSQNLLPFDWCELKRYGFSFTSFRLLILRQIQAKTFRKADGVIFLSHFAHDLVSKLLKDNFGHKKIIYHGVNDKFYLPPREQKPIDNFSFERPFRILYVSIVDVYKHQWHVVDAVAQLRANGFPVALDLVGPSYQPALNRLWESLDRVAVPQEFVTYKGSVNHSKLHAHYAEANLFIFASSCETFGQILTEAMFAGLPIACSNRSVMPEILGDAGLYFDPENPDDIKDALCELINSPELRVKFANASFARAQAFSWNLCAAETFGFLANISSIHVNKSMLAENY